MQRGSQGSYPAEIVAALRSHRQGLSPGAAKEHSYGMAESVPKRAAKPVVNVVILTHSTIEPGPERGGQVADRPEIPLSEDCCQLVGRFVLVTSDSNPVPVWLRELADAARTMDVPTPLVPPSTGGTRSAALVLLAEGPGGPDVLLIQRAKQLRLHAGEMAFPGGAIDATDAGPVAAALREASEEAGVEADDVDVVATLPELYIPPTAFRVVPVLAWWRRPRAVGPGDPREVAAVGRISMEELANPAGRLMLHRPEGIVLPAFQVEGRLIWGMTAAVMAQLLTLAGWDRPWDASVVEWL